MACSEAKRLNRIIAQNASRPALGSESEGTSSPRLHQTVQLQPLEQRIRGPVAHVTHTRRNSPWHASQVTAKSTLEAAIGFMGPTEPSTYLSDILRK